MLGKGGGDAVVDEVGCEDLEVEIGGADGSLRTLGADAGAEDEGTIDKIRSVWVMPCVAVVALPDGDPSMGDGEVGIGRTGEAAAEA